MGGPKRGCRGMRVLREGEGVCGSLEWGKGYRGSSNRVYGYGGPKSGGRGMWVLREGEDVGGSEERGRIYGRCLNTRRLNGH